MRVLFTFLPGTGSLRPLLPLAQALRAQGHEVALCSAPALRPAVERQRLPFLAAGLDWDTSDPRYIEVLCAAAGGLKFPPLTGMARLAWVTNVRIERYLPLTALLPRCDLFVTHGGFNSVKESLAAGVPMVLVPISADQPYSAERCAALGVGVALGPEERTAAVVRHAGRTVLAERAYTRRAREMQREMAALPGPDHTVALLEALHRNPVPPQPAVAGRTP